MPRYNRSIVVLDLNFFVAYNNSSVTETILKMFSSVGAKPIISGVQALSAFGVYTKEIITIDSFLDVADFPINENADKFNWLSFLSSSKITWCTPYDGLSKTETLDMGALFIDGPVLPIDLAIRPLNLPNETILRDSSVFVEFNYSAFEILPAHTRALLAELNLLPSFIMAKLQNKMIAPTKFGIDLPVSCSPIIFSQNLNH